MEGALKAFFIPLPTLVHPREEMDSLIRSLDSLRRGEAGRIVRRRMAEFSHKGQGSREEVFKELCFCLLTANYTSEGGIRIQDAIGDGFLTMGRAELAARLKSLGYRFPNARARYIVEARRHSAPLSGMLASGKGDSELREWLASNVLGLGYKESSHFLRNIGRKDLAIIDFHIIDLLERNGLIKRPESKSLNKKSYLEIEAVLGAVALRAGMSQGELDLYLWYMETGKILK